MIKALVLVDSIVKFTPSPRDLDELDKAQRWVVHVDGSSTLPTGGIRVVLQSPEGDELKYKVRLQYSATNNKVEYETLLKGLELANEGKTSLCFSCSFMEVKALFSSLYH